MATQNCRRRGVHTTINNSAINKSAILPVFPRSYSYLSSLTSRSLSLACCHPFIFSVYILLSTLAVLCIQKNNLPPKNIEEEGTVWHKNFISLVNKKGASPIEKEMMTPKTIEPSITTIKMGTFKEERMSERGLEYRELRRRRIRQCQ